MQLSLKDIPRCVINLPHRTDRLEKFRTELSLLFDDDSINVVPGVIDAKPMNGVARAHMNCIKLAKDNNWERVLIMEDDLWFQSPAKLRDYTDKAFQAVPDDFEILLGGIYQGENMSKHNEYWDKVGEFCALHFYIVNQSCYDTILNYDYQHHIDRWMNRTGQFRCYVTRKLFAIQYDGYSDNAKKTTDYLPYLSKFQLL